MKIMNEFSTFMENLAKKGKSGFFSLAFAFGVIALASLLTVGCGSDSTNTSNSADETGDVIIGLTDADGDFLTYTVDVVSLTLTKANGTIIQTLPLSTTVDFAQYTEMTEFFTIATIPSGVYTHATMQLDYTNADIQVEMNGESVSAEIQDENGNAITTLDVTVKLANTKKLLIVPGVPAYLTLDFDLQASNDVDISVTPPIVTVEPFLIADVDPEQSKTHRLRGLLKSVDTEDETFKVHVRPFHMRPKHKSFGTITVKTTSDTFYEIDGQTYEGSDGLEALSAKPATTPMVIFGDLRFRPRRFEAKEVYAGTSVPWGTHDAVTGNVIKRVGDTLTVRGMTIDRENGRVVFNNNITVELDPDTNVTCQAIICEAAGIDNISIGQRIIAFGSLSGQEPGSLSLDTTDGFVRMLVTSLRGEIVSAETGSLVLNLQSIDHRTVTIFDFTGTGTRSEEDADPTNYEIGTGALDLGALDSDYLIKVRGFVSPFGTAPDDFNAITVINSSALGVGIITY